MGWDVPWHWVVLAIAFLVLFGYKKLPDASRSVGRSLRIFKTELKGMSEDDKARENAVDADQTPTPAPQPPAPLAEAVEPRPVPPPPAAPAAAPAAGTPRAADPATPGVTGAGHVEPDPTAQQFSGGQPPTSGTR